MLKRIFSGVILTLLLIGMFTLTFNIQPVEASGTVYIRADGSVDPPSAPISTVDNVTYVFTGNIYDENVVERSNIIIEGNGYTVQGTFAEDSKGIYLSSVHNVIVKNLNIKEFDYGIYLDFSSNNNSISGNNITANNGDGIRIHSSSNNNSISGNNITNNADGIHLYSSNNCISGNNITNNSAGVYLDFPSNNNSISGNNITANNWAGIYLYYSSNNCISGNNITNNWAGIYPQYSSNNCISGNNITNNADGIFLCHSSNNCISGNNITNNGDGIYIHSSSNNSFSGNNITNNGYGIYLRFSSNNNSISGNNITANNGDGILLYSSSNDNCISGNNITNNRYGIYLDSSSNNSIYHNNFVNNTQQAYSSESVNVWDDGYPSGGNYWSDYVGVDVKSGPGQDLPGSDGIGDTPYIIDADNVDHYPLMNPYGAPPPQTYTLTITSTVGGTTDPPLGTYSYTANSSVQVTAVPEAGYLFDYWELDDVNVGSANPYSVLMDKDHTLKAVFSPIPPPLSASISPLSASINVGQSVTFTSTVSGGTSPYSYQWYLDGNPVSGANASSWTFTPSTSGIYYVYLKVTDAKGNSTQSETARITVAAVPVGGYYLPIQLPTTAKPVTIHIALLIILTAIFVVKLKPKTKRKR